MPRRQGLGKGLGRGFYNLLPLDSYIHSLAARGVTSVDLNRYSGVWYEQASIPAWFQKGCKGTQARYTPLPDGKILVENTCTTPEGKRGVKGVARSVSADNRNLKVSFFPPFEGDYKIDYLSPDYKKAVVSSGDDDKFLWLLSREKRLSKKELARLKEIARKKGRKVSALSAKSTAPFKLSEKTLAEWDIDPENIFASKDKRYGETPVRIMWNPDTNELLLAGETAHSTTWLEHMRKSAQKTRFNEWVRGIYLPKRDTLFIRHYWNPENPYAEFTARAFTKSMDIQAKFAEKLAKAGMPADTKVKYNITNQDLAGVGFFQV